jgi:hypothetical protein
MPSISIRFTNEDFVEPLPSKGAHEATILNVRCRTSESGNPLIQVTFQLLDEEPPKDRVVDHFIVAGATPRAVAIGRQRLLSMCRACGVEPTENENLALDDLLGRALEVRLDHDTYLGSKRARVRGYRSLS